MSILEFIQRLFSREISNEKLLEEEQNTQEGSLGLDIQDDGDINDGSTDLIDDGTYNDSNW